MKVRNLRKLILFVFFLFVLNGCDQYGITLPNQVTTTEIQSTELSSDTGIATTFPTTTVGEISTTEISTTVTTEITTVSELTEQLMSIYQLALESGSFEGTYEEWLETVRGPQGEPGDQVLLQVAEGYIQWKYDSDETWMNLIALSELSVSGGHVISSMSINDLGDLILSYSDGEEVNLGEMNLKFTVNFIGFHGYLIDSQYVVYGQDAIEPTPPPIEGYTFTGWDIDFTNVMTNLSVTAQYLVQSYTVLFYDEDGSLIEERASVDHGSSLSLFVPEKTGHYFMGWFLGTDVNAGQFTSNDRITSNLSLYARWALEGYTVIFIDYDDRWITAQEVAYGYSAIEPKDPQRTGYTFTGWDTDFRVVESDLRVRATYEINHYDIYFDVNGGDADIPPLLDIAYQSLAALPDPSRSDYDFVGWYWQDELITVNTPITEDMVLIAHWQPHLYAISFDTNFEDYYVLVEYGKGFAIAVDNQNRIFAWGRNDYYQLGTLEGDTIPHVTATEVTENIGLQEGDQVVLIEATYEIVILLTESGQMFGWGSNEYGETGVGRIGTVSTPERVDVNFDLISEEIIVQVSLGTDHLLVLTSTGRVFAVGYNNAGQLGDGTNIDTLTPIDITANFNLNDGETITMVATGSYHSLAITDQGRIFAWGHDQYSQVGDSATNYSVNTPKDITGNFGLLDGEYFIDIDGNYYQSAAVTSLGRIFTWGLNYYGELGIGTKEPSTTPYDITPSLSLVEGERVVGVETTRYFTLVYTNHNRIFGFGLNEEYCIDDSETLEFLTAFDMTNRIFFNEGEDIVSVSSEEWVVSVLTNQGRLFTWGKNTDDHSGALGDGTTIDRAIPYSITDGFIKVDDQFHQYGDFVDGLPFLTMSNYIFDGWYFNDQPVTLPFVYDMHEDMTLTATWKSSMDDLTYDITPTGVVITGYTGEDSRLIIPDYIKGLPVVGIGDEAFRGNSVLTYIKVGEYVEFIGNSAFREMPNLVEIVLVDATRNIGSNVFYLSNKINTMTLSCLTNYDLAYLFGGDINYIPSSLEGVVFAQGSNTLMMTFFESYLPELTIDLPSDWTEVPDELFMNVDTIQYVLLPEGITRIGQSAFQNSSIKIVYFPDSLETVDDYAFRYAESLADIIITEESNLKVIGNNAFEQTINLKEFYLPEGLTTINDNAFCHSGIVKLVIPSTLTTMGLHVFEDVDAVILVVVESIPETWNSNWNVDADVFLGYLGIDIYESFIYAYSVDQAFIIGLSDDFAGPDIWIENVLNDYQVVGIRQAAFEGNLLVENVYIDSAITKIPEKAFYNCENLSVLVFAGGSQLEIIGSYAFAYTMIEEINLPSNVTIIDEYAFEYCTNLVSITFSEDSHLQRIENGAFKFTDNLSSIILPSTIEYIGYSTFFNTGLQTVIFEDGTADLYFSGLAFAYNPLLIYFTIPERVSYIDADCFKESNLMTIFAYHSIEPLDWDMYWKPGFVTVVWDYKETISDGTFVYALTNHSTAVVLGLSLDAEGEHYIIPEYINEHQITEISTYAFANDEKIVTIEIPNAVEEISSFVFAFTLNLETVIFGTDSSLDTIEEGAFFGSSIKYIELPSNLRIIRAQAFDSSSIEGVYFAENSQLYLIDVYAFSQSRNLRFFYIDNQVTQINDAAFSGCYAITIFVEASSKPDSWSINWNPQLMPVIWGVQEFGTYENFDYVITSDSTIAVLGSNHFSEDITVIDIPNDINGNLVTYISRYAFSSREDIKYIALPLNIDFVGEHPFGTGAHLILVSEMDGPAVNWDETWNDNWNWGIDIYWNSSLYQIYFDENGGSEVNDLIGITSLEIEELPSPTKEGYDFVGWYDNPELSGSAIETPYNHGTTDHITLYAKWDIVIIEDDPSDYTFILLENDTYEVTDYVGSNSTYVIPSSYLGKPVTSIGNRAFAFNTNLTNVVIPSTITNIGDEAFLDCSGLTAITLPDSLITIGNYTFNNCINLTTINIPDHVTSIGNHAFNNCYNLESIYIPASVISIGDVLFYNCYNLESITVAEDNPNYSSEDGVLFDKEKTILYEYPDGKLDDTYVIPEGILTIGRDAFRESVHLVHITIPSSVTTIDFYAFTQCSSLTSINIPSSVITIGWGAFYNCLSLTIYAEVQSKLDGWDELWNTSDCPVVWGVNTSTIYFDTMEGTLIDPVTQTEGSVVNAPENPSKIDYLFDGWFTEPELINDYTFSTMPVEDITLYAKWVSMGTSFTTAIPLNMYEDITIDIVEAGQRVYLSFNPSVTGTYYIYSVGYYATLGNLYDDTGTLIIESSEQINGYNFLLSYELTGGMTYYIETGLSSETDIGTYEVYISDMTPDTYSFITSVNTDGYITIEGIEGEALALIIPEQIDGLTVTEIADGAFQDNTDMVYVMIPTTVTYIGMNAFSGCTNLLIAWIPSSVLVIGANAFANSPYLIVLVESGADTTNWDMNWHDDGVIVYEGWSEIYTTYSFVVNGGTPVEDMTSAYGIYEPYTFKAGYEVTWYLTEDFSGDTVTFPYYAGLEGTVYLYAKWTVITATSISLDEEVSVVIDETGENMYYTFTPSESGTYDVYTIGSFDTVGTLYDQDFNWLYDNDDYTDLNFYITYDLIAGQTYYIKTHMYSPYDLGTYTLIVSAHQEEPTGDFDTATEISVNTEVGLTIAQEGEMIYLTFTPTESGQYDIYSFGTYDTVGLLYASDYSLIMENDDGDVDTNFKMTYQLEAGVTYYLVVHMYSQYDLGDITVVVEQHTNDTSGFDTATLILLDQEVTVTIDEGGEIVYYAFTPSTTATYEIFASGAYDTIGALYDAEYNLLTSNDDSTTGVNFNMVYDLVADNTYYILASMYSDTDLGSFTMIVSEYDTSTGDSAFSSAIDLSLDTPLTVTIDGAGEVLYYAFTPSTSGDYIIYTSGDWDTIGALYDSSEMILSADDDSGLNGSFAITYTLTGGSTYYITIAMFSEYDIGSFTLEVNETNGTAGLYYSLLDDDTLTVDGYMGLETDVVIPSTYLGYTITTISAYAFAYNEDITTVTLPGTITYIDDAAFFGCINLTSVNLPNSVAYVGWYVFGDCSSLIIDLGDNVDTSAWDPDSNPDNRPTA